MGPTIVLVGGGVRVGGARGVGDRRLRILDARVPTFQVWLIVYFNGPTPHLLPPTHPSRQSKQTLPTNYITK